MNLKINQMKRTLFFTILFCWVICNNLMAQSINSDQNIGKQYFEMGEFFRWGHGTSGKPSFTKAINAYKKSASLGYPDGIMAIGEMYQKGMGGLKKDVKKAFELFLVAYKMGSGRACYNLGKSYAYGLGCEVDYEKMIFYLNEGVRRDDHSSMYGMGDMLYKGWGVEQSYEKAVELFEKAASLGSLSSKYYLGICYRNGYGVVRDEEKGKGFLKEAASIDKFAKKELNESTPEIERGKKIQNREYDSPGKYKKIDHLINSESIQGNWKGEITIYDWSGQHKLDQKPVELKFEVTGDLFSGNGICNGEPIALNGFNNKFGIEFNSGQFNYVDHYRDSVVLKIETGSFNTFTNGSKIVLAGNISLFSITENTPSRPAFLVITKEKEKEPKEKSSIVAEEKQSVTNDLTNNEVETESSEAVPYQDNPNAVTIAVDVSKTVKGTESKSLMEQLKTDHFRTRIWPVPFNDNLNIEYNLLSKCAVEIRLLSVDGKLIKTLNSDMQLPGYQKRNFHVTVNPGVYLIQITAGNQHATHRVIKQ